MDLFLRNVPETLQAFYFGMSLRSLEDSEDESIYPFWPFSDEVFWNVPPRLCHIWEQPGMRFVHLELPGCLLHQLIEDQLQNNDLESYSLFLTDVSSFSLIPIGRGQRNHSRLLDSIGTDSLLNLKQVLILQTNFEGPLLESPAERGAVLLETKLALDALVEDSLVDEHKRMQAKIKSSRSWIMEAELVRVGAKRNLEVWRRRDQILKTFRSNCAALYGVMTKYRKLAWIVLEDGSVVPLDLAEELGLLKKAGSIEYERDLGIWEHGLFVDI